MIPAGIPQGLTRGQVARALRFKEETVKGLLSSGRLASFQLTEGRGWRFVRPEDLEVFAAECGLTVYWDEVEVI